MKRYIRKPKVVLAILWNGNSLTDADNFIKRVEKGIGIKVKERAVLSTGTLTFYWDRGTAVVGREDWVCSDPDDALIVKWEHTFDYEEVK